ncbi:hypothetical protein CMO88_00625 [Candidatus Woesearchaeota archaeon]|nr:hypothetical protein [Candidatus Woesearchaeota archaeon]|tara:strand:- start:11492 stop:12289 length:798 start_codon:yes stop_codon:yes gene_type:complete
MQKLDFAIVVSKKDPAGMSISEQLRQLQQFPATIGDKKVDLFVKGQAITEVAVDDINADNFIFASKHVSKARVHSLSVHSIGNWSKVIGGGREKTLVAVPAALMKTCFKLLTVNAEKAKIDYEIILEATHHGPYLEKPVMFIEIGSDEEHWKDKTAGKVIADTILEAIKNISDTSEEIKTVVGIGGMHHAPNFTKVMLAEDVSVSYLCPKYMLESLDEEMLKQAIDKSKANSVVLDWKGLGKEKARIVDMLEKNGVNYKRTKDFA